MIMRSISVVLPIYNEEANIKDVISQILFTLPSMAVNFEIIAVNDGSIDKTAVILNDLQALDNRIKVISHPVNRGYGAALISGFKQAKNELVLMMDADRQFNISDIIKFAPYIEDFDLVAGLRIKRKDSFFRCLLGFIFKVLVKFIFGIKSKDVNCGFKLFKANLIQNMQLSMQGNLINVEIMALANINKAKVKEIGVNHYPRVNGKPTGGNPKVILKAILSSFRLMHKLWAKNSN